MKGRVGPEGYVFEEAAIQTSAIRRNRGPLIWRNNRIDNWNAASKARVQGKACITMRFASKHVQLVRGGYTRFFREYSGIRPSSEGIEQSAEAFGNRELNAPRNHGNPKSATCSA